MPDRALRRESHTSGFWLLWVWCATGVIAWAGHAEAADAWWIRIKTPHETYAISPDGKERRALPPEQSPDQSPRRAQLRERLGEEMSRFGEKISPDGARLLYVSGDADGHDAEIFVADADGNNKRQLTDNDAIDNLAEWSPDGQHILFASTRSGKWQVFVMDADGGNVKEMSHEEDGAWEPQYSPEGRRIAYLARREPFSEGGLGPRQVDLVVTDGKTSRRLADDRRIDSFAWSPHGDAIAYSPREYDRNGYAQLSVLWLSGDALGISLVGADPPGPAWQNIVGIRWRPDGLAIAFTTSPPAVQTMMGSPPPNEPSEPKPLFIAPLDRPTIHRLMLEPGSTYDWMKAPE